MFHHPCRYGLSVPDEPFYPPEAYATASHGGKQAGNAAYVLRSTIETIWCSMSQHAWLVSWADVNGKPHLSDWRPKE